MLADVHAHLDFKEYQPDLDDVIARAVEAQVGFILTSGIDLQSSRKAVSLADKYAPVFATAGIHPHEAEKAGPDDLREIEKLLRHPKVVAVGEIGLDFHYGFAGRDAQFGLFREQLALARSCGMAAVIHSRAAEAEALEEVRQAGVSRSLFHCFTGSPETGRAIIAAGYHIGITGIITFNNPSNALLAAQLPPRALLTETDAPFLTPAPKRGKRNEPANIAVILSKLASLFPEMTAQMLELSIMNNIRHLFNVELK